MEKGISVSVIKDSISTYNDHRLTTMIWRYPRFIHSEFMTHRMFSKNAASTRAIPTKKIIQSILDDPAMPVFWGKNQAGMQAKEELDDILQHPRVIKVNLMGEEIDRAILASDKKHAEYLWLRGRDEVIKIVEELVSLGLHKQIAGRMLETWFYITVLVSGTSWDNLTFLRAHEDAQPEFKDPAYKALDALNNSIPEIVEAKWTDFDFTTLSCFSEEGELLKYASEELDWHLPFSEKMPERITPFERIQISTARNARLSYLTFDGEMDKDKDFDIYSKLVEGSPKHLSPTEHVAFPIKSGKYFGNFQGWVQLRKLYKEENATDPRIIKRKIVNGIVV